MSFKVILVYPPHLRPIIPSPCYTPIITHHSETNMHNLANLPQDEKDKINADLSEITGNKKPAGAGVFLFLI